MTPETQTLTPVDRRVEETPDEIKERFNKVIADAALGSASIEVPVYADPDLGYVDPNLRAPHRRAMANAEALTRAERTPR